MEPINRRQFIKYSGAGLVTAMVLPSFSWMNLAEKGGEIVIDTAFGKLKGYQQNGVNIFKGVPYAGKISGNRRFLTPEPLKPWTGIREATKLGNPSIQTLGGYYGLNEPEPAEDSLTLNIWTPAKTDGKCPVMVYSHGGGFVAGSAGSTAQDGANLARMFNVVVVATNHRLGLLGYLYLDELAGDEYRGSGNRGVQDIALALKWINQNIRQFGGDPDNVMIFGESGGGLKTSCLYAMPEAAPYFHKASIESGPGIVLNTPETAQQTTLMLLKELNIAPKDWRKLLDMPAPKLLEAQVRLQSKSDWSFKQGFKGIGAVGPGNFGPVADGAVLPYHPFDPVAPQISVDKPLLVGWNEDEEIFFSMYGSDKEVFNLSKQGLLERLQKDFGTKAARIVEFYSAKYPEATPTEIYMKVYSLLSMGLGSLLIAERKSEQGTAPVYLYNFGYKSENIISGTNITMGAMHAMDIPFKFYNVDGSIDASGTRTPGMEGSRPERFTASKNMSTFWTNFAHNGKPSAAGQPEWPAYNNQTRPMMRIDTQCQPINNRFTDEVQLWREVF
ncbi:MAG TPA: carboxylesterase/lipase family protein [Marinilabiliales bacterium]|nr:MAG: carboxylesterase [Bacteroidetes bacterium GWA2_40_14]OFX71914.1 MAG: carboxylesterase [Bacteroidetes bacterium GWD2_40_43]OFX94711.1 MAG: carboxylesterase [Bacteroidetes bacterium GWE2_40_63]OFY24760.1 MAG: carboxylesterase [Bacteroidetes bacterium GWF2_40_13]OFZ24476.1 MAG: carboxylesterase [Bacteroidetes bacterium RIFOXYC2_FULL_40_12]HAM98479.1 carboxylesterase/lipase family protein [Marinilabiliales bacterium]